MEIDTKFVWTVVWKSNKDVCRIYFNILLERQSTQKVIVVVQLMVGVDTLIRRYYTSCCNVIVDTGWCNIFLSLINVSTPKMSSVGRVDTHRGKDLTFEGLYE